MKGIESTYLYAHGGYFTVIAVGVLIIIATLVLSQLLVTIMHRALNKTTGGEVGGSIIANVIRVGVWIVGLSILLKACFDYNTAVLWGALGIGGIALSLGLQNTISNLIGGLQMSLSRDLTLGDWVTVGNITGQIKDITWRVMKVQDSSGNNYILPNAMLNTTAISVLPPYQTISLPLVFSDSIDLDSVQTDIPQIAYAGARKRRLPLRGHEAGSLHRWHGSQFRQRDTGHLHELRILLHANSQMRHSADRRAPQVGPCACLL